MYDLNCNIPRKLTNLKCRISTSKWKEQIINSGEASKDQILVEEEEI
jgi:hypothetical protein